MELITKNYYKLLYIIFITFINEYEFEVIATNQTSVNPINSTYDFKLLLRPSCDNQSYFLLVYVHSSPGNLKNRLLIRETWASYLKTGARTVFIVGLSTSSEINKLISLESSIYNDIVQADFIDSYRNLTYKGITALKWITEYCKNVDYVLKLDDDIVVNIFVLIRHLNYIQSKNELEPKSIMCNLHRKMKVIRDKKSKWYLSKEEFKDDYFGKYCSGSAFLLSGDLPPLMYRKSLKTDFFWVDDYFITGILAKALKVKFYEFNSLYQLSQKKVLNTSISQNNDFRHVFYHYGNVKKSN